MKIKIGVMGSAGNVAETDEQLKSKARALGEALAKYPVILMSGATTGVVYLVGKAAHDAGLFHIGVSPGTNLDEHVERYELPVDACDALIYTGFGLKGRNVVLVRSCDVVLFIAGAMGSLNEFTIAHDESKIIGCLRQTGGVADEVGYLLERFSRRSDIHVFQNDNPDDLIKTCLSVIARNSSEQ
jgi:uncharacterized protein (TIGR00725 family)